jgi:hypothetical protein
VNWGVFDLTFRRKVTHLEYGSLWLR